MVFICTFDPFGLGLYRYTFENMCRERELPLDDGAKKIFLNTKGINEDEVPRELIEFLRYVEDTTDSYVAKVDDRRIRKIHEHVVNIKKSRTWEGRYMRFEELLRKSAEQAAKQAAEKAAEQGRKEGIKEGKKEGEKKTLRLVNCMIKNGESDQIPRLEEEPEFLQAMLEKYQLS